MSNKKILEEANESEPKLLINDLLRVEFSDDVNPGGSYYCRVDDIAEKIMVTTWPTERGELMSVYPNQTLNFFITHEGNAYSFSGLVDRVNGDLMPRITVIIYSAIHRIQRRQDFRVKCVIPLEVIATLPETLGDAKPTTMHLKTNTYDLSASGISLRTKAPIPDGTIPMIRLSIPDGVPPIKTSCRMIHCFAAPDNPGKFYVGLKFLRINENNRARIVRFIYQTQIKGIEIN